MKYEFVGKKILGTGKTLWEIVGNLKNFGVGRYVIQTPQSDLGPDFLKIIKVQPYPPHKDQFIPRNVIVWIQKYYMGLTPEPTKTFIGNNLAIFQLIPKSEEQNYLNKHHEYSKKLVKKIFPEFMSCPPLYKELWENHYKEITNKVKVMPKIKSCLHEDSLYEIEIDKNTEAPPLTCNLHKLNVSVEDMIKKAVYYKKIIKSQSVKSD